MVPDLPKCHRHSIMLPGPTIPKEDAVVLAGQRQGGLRKRNLPCWQPEDFPQMIVALFSLFGKKCSLQRVEATCASRHPAICVEGVLP